MFYWLGGLNLPEGLAWRDELPTRKGRKLKGALEGVSILKYNRSD